MPRIKIDESTQPQEVRAEGRRLYEVYIANSDGLNFQGQPCPEWDALPSAIRSHWCAVALAASLTSPPKIAPEPIDLRAASGTLEPPLPRTKTK